MSEGLPRIKFSYLYWKLLLGDGGRCRQAKLLEVLDVRLEDLSTEMLKYDTQHSMEEHYKLPAKGDYLMLIFEKQPFGCSLFTTLRRSTPRKREYYRKLIGRVFEVVVPEVRITAGYSMEEREHE